MINFTFNTVNSIINATGAATQLAETCAHLNISRPIVITDPGIKQTGILQRVINSLTTNGIESAIFDQVIADPPETVVNSAVACAKQYQADGVIGLGGGSSLDTAKLVALLANSNESLADIYGVDRVTGTRLPLIMVPTTAGTGSEVTAVAIVTTGETTKMGVVSQKLIADVALLDAELTVGLPASITAMTGIDAMVHAIEAYTSIHKKNPYSDMLACRALQLLASNIKTAFTDGANLEARQAMLLGACLAGQAFANAPVAAVHALAYPLGGHYHLPHGLTNSLVLPAVLNFNLPSATGWYAKLAELLLPKNRLAAKVSERAEQFLNFMGELIITLKLPTQLSQVNVPEADLPMLAREAMLQQRLLINNPRPVSEDDALAIYRHIF